VLCVYLGFQTFRTFSGVTDVIVGGWFGVIVNDSRVEPRKWRLLDLFSLKRMRSTLLNAEGLTLRTLRDIDSPITHVFTATDLRHGEHFHFSQHWATSNTYGPTDPGDIRVDEAVRASAAFPGALPPVNIALDRLRLPPHLTVGIRHLQLVDGGVRDNLGHVFQSQLLGDSDSQRGTLTRYGSTRLSIVADASAPRGVADLSESVLARIPGLRRIGQLVTFPRVLSIMNQSNSEARSLALSTRFSDGIGGFVVGIRDSPVELCRQVIDDEAVARRLLRGGAGSGRTDNPRKLRAEAALRALVRNDGAAESHWNGDCNQNQMVPTTLDGLGSPRVATLIRHGYVLTMCHAHVELEWPLAPDGRWSADRLTDLLREEPAPA
jgi:hypothetical protein